MKKNKKFLLISATLLMCMFVLSGCSKVSLTGVSSTGTVGAGGQGGTPPTGTPPNDGGTPPADGGAPPAGDSTGGPSGN